MDAPEPESFLAGLTPAESAELERRARYRRWGRGAVIFHEGELPGWVVILLTGRVKVSSHGENGVEVVLAVRGPGSLLGETSAIDRLPRSATVATLEPAESLVLTADEFLAYLEAHNRVSLVIMRMLCHRQRDADRKRVEFGMLDATGRVAQRLVELAERYGEPWDPRGRGMDPAGTPSVRITLSLTQEELAGWVGASREAVSKALRTMRAHGWIETGRRRMVVHDMQALRRHAGR